ncbi:MAG: transketolase [Clostridia bacterium]|nr:transketolase [Clostridia bacterium]
MNEIEKLQDLKEKAAELRRVIVKTVYEAQSGHIGGSLSSAEILTALYFSEMKLDPAQPRMEERDRFVLSKGHVTPAYYGALAMKGFFPLEDLKGFRKLESYLQGHPDRNKVAGVDMSSGSLGQGVSAAVGIALAGKLKGADWRTYTLLGDGEIQEGQVWEAFMFAAQHKLDNLCVIIDNNGLQADGSIDAIASPNPIDEKLRAFGFSVCVIDGHDFKEILNAFRQARNTRGMPTAIIAKTVKGKGVSFMENQSSWHGKAPNAEQFAQAWRELEVAR